MKYRLQVKAHALNKRSRIPPSFPDENSIVGVVLQGFSFIGERVHPSEMNGRTERWYRDRDGYYYMGRWLMETEEVLTPPKTKAARKGAEPETSVPAEIAVQNDYNTLVQHIPTEWRLTRGKNIKVAVLDSSFVVHADLKNNIIQSFNAVDGTSDVKPMGNDDVNHGNNVSGLIAASSSVTEGILGVAPDAKIIVIKVSKNGRIDCKSVLAGLDFAINKAEAQIINMSISIDKEEYTPFREAFLKLFETAKENGIIIIGSAGDNSGLLGKKESLLLPSNEEYCLSVGTINQTFITNNPAPVYHSRLNYIIPNQFLRSCAGIDNTYSNISNSSMAAGILSGVAALVYSHHNRLMDKVSFVEKLNSALEKITNNPTLNLSIYKV